MISLTTAILLATFVVHCFGASNVKQYLPTRFNSRTTDGLQVQFVLEQQSCQTETVFHDSVDISLLGNLTRNPVTTSCPEIRDETNTVWQNAIHGVHFDGGKDLSTVWSSGSTIPIVDSFETDFSIELWMSFDFANAVPSSEYILLEIGQMEASQSQRCGPYTSSGSTKFDHEYSFRLSLYTGSVRPFTECYIDLSFATDGHCGITSFGPLNLQHLSRISSPFQHLVVTVSQSIEPGFQVRKLYFAGSHSGSNADPTETKRTQSGSVRIAHSNDNFVLKIGTGGQVIKQAQPVYSMMGDISLIALYNTSLTQEQVNQNYDAFIPNSRPVIVIGESVPAILEGVEAGINVGSHVSTFDADMFYGTTSDNILTLAINQVPNIGVTGLLQYPNRGDFVSNSRIPLHLVDAGVGEMIILTPPIQHPTDSNAFVSITVTDQQSETSYVPLDIPILVQHPSQTTIVPSVIGNVSQSVIERDDIETIKKVRFHLEGIRFGGTIYAISSPDVNCKEANYDFLTPIQDLESVSYLGSTITICYLAPERVNKLGVIPPYHEILRYEQLNNENLRQSFGELSFQLLEELDTFCGNSAASLENTNTANFISDGVCTVLGYEDSLITIFLFAPQGGESKSGTTFTITSLPVHGTLRNPQVLGFPKIARGFQIQIPEGLDHAKILYIPSVEYSNTKTHSTIESSTSTPDTFEFFATLNDVTSSTELGEIWVASTNDVLTPDDISITKWFESTQDTWIDIGLVSIVHPDDDTYTIQAVLKGNSHFVNYTDEFGICDEFCDQHTLSIVGTPSQIANQLSSTQVRLSTGPGIQGEFYLEIYDSSNTGASTRDNSSPSFTLTITVSMNAAPTESPTTRPTQFPTITTLQPTSFPTGTTPTRSPTTSSPTTPRPTAFPTPKPTLVSETPSPSTTPTSAPSTRLVPPTVSEDNTSQPPTSPPPPGSTTSPPTPVQDGNSDNTNGRIGTITGASVIGSLAVLVFVSSVFMVYKSSMYCSRRKRSAGKSAITHSTTSGAAVVDPNVAQV